jgi:UDP-N-acetylmuramyl-tripeptide synthetase
MWLGELIQVLKYKQVKGNLQLWIKNITTDSRKVTAGSLFICVRGFIFDGHDYINQAIEKGAVAILIDKDVSVPANITSIKVRSSRDVVGNIAANFYGYPAEKLKLIGITGTNGKTTVVYLTEAMLKKAGYKVGRLSTISYQIDKFCIKASHTTPDSIELQQLLKKAVDCGCRYVVMEVSSHALSLARVVGCEFDIAGFTNLGDDHLDFHGTKEEYLKAKLKLFSSLGELHNKGLPKTAIINADSEYKDRIIRVINTRYCQIRKYGINNPADIYATGISVREHGISFQYRDVVFNLNIIGLCNIYNALLVIGIGECENIDMQIIKEGIESVKHIPGRFERIDCGQKFTVIVDYAHSSDALENVLITCKQLLAENKHSSRRRIITVFGCGGERDTTKRPQMGKISGIWSDYTIITNDNPRGEKPEDIVKDIERGIKQTNGKYIIILDREEAISHAISIAKEGDIVLIAGKGHEDYQILGDTVVHFDDREVVRNVLSKIV